MTIDDVLRDLLRGAPAGLFRRCVYCGSRCYGRTCQWHRDLPQLEHTDTKGQ